MKKLKKLIPAFCMLLVSVAMLGTSTFAWFSMNKEVKATGMQITAKSDSVYLLIMEGEKTAPEVQTNNSASAAATNPENTAMLPAAHETIKRKTPKQKKPIPRHTATGIIRLRQNPPNRLPKRPRLRRS